MSFQKILIAVDAGPLAAHAAAVGAELARSLGAQAALISVVDTSPAGAAGSEALLAELTAQARMDAKQLIVSIRGAIASGPMTLEFTPEGAAAEEIVKAAASWPADMIVIGSHGRNELGRVLLGSVAETVMRHACCPVLVVRRRLS
jgi:nucleotide-binding universal stress UspA family protein